MKSLKKKTLVKKASGGPMAEKPTSGIISSEQSKKYNVPKGTSYNTSPSKPSIRQKFSDYANVGPSPQEVSTYSRLKREASDKKMQEINSRGMKPAMKRGGSIPKKQEGGSIGNTTESQVFRPNMQPPGGFKPTPVPRKVRKQMERYEDAASKQKIDSIKRKPIPGPTDREGKKLYQDSKVTPMKKGGSMSKMTMMKKGGAMKVSTIKKKK